jgi:hypothetical protein
MVPPAATLAPPAARPANNHPGSQERISRQIPGQPGTQNLPDTARTNLTDSLLTNAPNGGTVTPQETDSATLTFDQHIVKILRKTIIGTYLLVLLILLLLLAFKLRQRANRKKKQREDAH